MDEIFGYLPPTANPPSKTPMLTLLKQARAFGVGLVLSTQNPVDLDYKALSNAGTWFIGRLQTERDKERVLAGLQGASQDGFDKADMERMLANLGKRVFLMHNVNEDEPVVFHTRWVMSYLSGPMTRDQIKRLMADREVAPAQTETLAHAESSARVPAPQTPSANEPPIMPQDVPVFYAPASGSGTGLVYYPAVAAFSEVYYSSVTHGVNLTKPLNLICELEDGPVPVDWDSSEMVALQPGDLDDKPLTDAAFGDLPKSVSSKSFTKWQKDLLKHIRQDRALDLYKCKAPKLTSEPGEPEGNFRARIGQLAREDRDLKVEKLRKKYAGKATTLQNRLLRAQQAIERETEQAQQRKMETVVNVGTALLGAVLGRKAVSRSTVSKASSSLKSAGRMQKEQQDVARARETAQAVAQQLADLEAELEKEVATLEQTTDPTTAALEQVFVKAKSSDITLDVFALVWLPYRKDAQGRLSSDWS